MMTDKAVLDRIAALEERLPLKQMLSIFDPADVK